MSISDTFDSFSESMPSISEMLSLLWQHQSFRILVYSILFVMFLNILPGLIKIYRARRRKKKIQRMFSEQESITPKEFLKMRKIGNKLNPALNVAGVYVIHNASKDLYYVGQGKSVSKRVFNHFNGSGNGDVYADYKYNDKFTIQLMPLSESGYDSLDELERYAIQAHNAYSKGYNRNRGNGWKQA